MPFKTHQTSNVGALPGLRQGLCLNVSCALLQGASLLYVRSRGSHSSALTFAPHVSFCARASRPVHVGQPMTQPCENQKHVCPAEHGLVPLEQKQPEQYADELRNRPSVVSLHRPIDASEPVADVPGCPFDSGAEPSRHSGSWLSMAFLGIGITVIECGRANRGAQSASRPRWTRIVPTTESPPTQPHKKQRFFLIA